jgi:8-oxo-dGTP pyrophosphatase MutT (NUDIX family)
VIRGTSNKVPGPRTEENKRMPATPRPASTVILLREKSPEGFEVFLLRRHQKSAFMGGNYVYPGGTVDRNDGSKEILSRCHGASLAQISSPVLDLFEYRIAGLRELFEEAGVLLANTVDGKPLGQLGQEDRERFSAYRKQLHSGEITLAKLAGNEDLLLAPDQLHYYVHWITPEANPLRFDTIFFIALHPSGQDAGPDLQETTEGIWIAPRQALDKNIEGTVPLSPPTLKTLEDLARFVNLQQLFASLPEAQARPLVLPVATTVNGENILVYPWDPEYEAYKKGAAESASHGSLSTPSDNTTRLVFREGRWLPFTKRDA